MFCGGFLFLPPEGLVPGGMLCVWLEKGLVAAGLAAACVPA